VRRYAGGLALAVVIATAGCGSGSGSGGDASATPASTASDSATPDAKASEAPKSDSGPCDLVSDQAVTAVLQVKIVRREPHGKAGSASVSCIKGVNRTNDPSKFSYVSVGVVGGGAEVLLDQVDGKAGSSPVGGLADRAIYLRNAGALFIADGDDAVQVQVVKGGKPGSQQDCVTIAKDVLSRRD
jgi:hypothetical protein